MENWLSSSPFGLLDLPVETIINFLLVYEAIDFSFWGSPKWSIDTEYGNLDGSIALLYAILKYVKENKTTDFSNIEKIVKELGVSCPKCSTGKIIIKNTKNRKKFFGCSNYPNCDFVSWDEPLDQTCPNCSQILYKKTGKNGKIYCANTECNYQK